MCKNSACALQYASHEAQAPTTMDDIVLMPHACCAAENRSRRAATHGPVFPHRRPCPPARPTPRLPDEGKTLPDTAVRATLGRHHRSERPRRLDRLDRLSQHAGRRLQGTTVRDQSEPRKSLRPALLQVGGRCAAPARPGGHRHPRGHRPGDRRRLRPRRHQVAGDPVGRLRRERTARRRAGACRARKRSPAPHPHPRAELPRHDPARHRSQRLLRPGQCPQGLDRAGVAVRRALHGDPRLGQAQQRGLLERDFAGRIERHRFRRGGRVPDVGLAHREHLPLRRGRARRTPLHERLAWRLPGQAGAGDQGRAQRCRIGRGADAHRCDGRRGRGVRRRPAPLRRGAPLQHRPDVRRSQCAVHQLPPPRRPPADDHQRRRAGGDGGGPRRRSRHSARPVVRGDGRQAQ